MGFYGNITNTSRGNFTFDRIYTNRHAMEQNKDKDGVLIGRYVLIEYGEFAKDSFIHAYTKDNTVFYLNINCTDESKIRYKKGQKPTGTHITQGMIIYTQDTDPGERKYYICNEGVDGSDATFTLIENSEVVEAQIYSYNSQQDFKSGYSNGGKGYDGTVWMKTKSNGVINYVNVAELNTVMPSFTISLMTPEVLDEPKDPYFGAQSNNFNYTLCMERPWKIDTPTFNYHKEGFDSKNKVAKSDKADGITVEGQNGVISTEINLPSIGDMMIDAWDIIYGTERTGTGWEGGLQGIYNIFNCELDEGVIPIIGTNAETKLPKLIGASLGEMTVNGKTLATGLSDITNGLSNIKCTVNTEDNTITFTDYTGTAFDAVAATHDWVKTLEGRIEKLEAHHPDETTPSTEQN